MASVFSLSTWLSTFLGKRKLQRPDQRPLYGYQTTSIEYEDLKAKLRGIHFKPQDFEQKAFCATFVLFCAEWYRREFETGWKWEPIFELLGFDLSSKELTKIVPKGLEQYWGRPIRYFDEINKRSFLGSLFSEGGLPFKVLVQSNSNFQGLFSKVLKQYANTGNSIPQLVNFLLKNARLPQVFSENSSVDLIIQMATQLVNIVRQYDLDEANEPVAVLDQLYPKWRDDFPIPLDDETGYKLLNSLLLVASEEEHEKSKDLESNNLVCQHFLSEKQQDKISIQVKLVLPRELVFELSSKPSSSRFELALYEDSQQIATLGIGYAKLADLRASIRSQTREFSIERINPLFDLVIAASVGGVVLGYTTITNSSISLGELPVGFEWRNERWQFCGQASFNCKTESMLLILPSLARVELKDSLYEEKAALFGYRTIEFLDTTCIRVRIADESYRILTGSDFKLTSSPNIKGVEFDWKTNPKVTYVGVPNVDNDIAVHSNICTYFSGKDKRQCSINDLLGVHYLSVRNSEGDTLLRKKIGVLPSDFRVKFVKGEQANQGSILFYSSIDCCYEVLGDINSKQLIHDGCVELVLLAKGIPPTYVDFNITPGSSTRSPIQVHLPFPAVGCIAVDKFGQLLKNTLSLDNLLGTYIYIFSHKDFGNKFRVSLYLVEDNKKRYHENNIFYRWFYNIKDQPLTLSLFSIKEQIESLLSLNISSNQMVELVVEGFGNSRSFYIKRYTARLVKDIARKKLQVNIDVSNSEQQIKPLLILFSEPERQPIELESKYSEGVATGVYELPLIVDELGPWLVIPEEGSILFDPIYIKNSFDCINNNELIEVRSLQKATQLYGYQKNQEDSFTTVLNEMAINPSHSGWQFLSTLYQHYSYLPLNTFEVWHTLFKNPVVLAMALFKFEMNPNFLIHIEKEFPLFWESMSVIKIKQAIYYFKNFALSKGIPEDILSGILKRMFKDLSSIFTIYDNEDFLEFFVFDKFPARLSQEVIDMAVKHWYQELMHKHSDENWPMFLGDELKNWYFKQTGCPILLDTEINYRNTIVYLPIFMACVAAERVCIEDVFRDIDSTNVVFLLRQIRDFDKEWFNAIYCCCLFNYALVGN